MKSKRPKWGSMVSFALQKFPAVHVSCGSKCDVSIHGNGVGFTPRKLTSANHAGASELCAMNGHDPACYSITLSAREERLGNRKANRLGGLEIDDQLVFGSLLHGQVGWFGALEDFVDIGSEAPNHVV